MIFNDDIRIQDSQIDYYHINNYDNYGKVREFVSLSCNKNNANEFVAGQSSK